MQIVSLHECQILFPGKKQRKYFIISTAENYTQNVKRLFYL